MIEPLRVAVVGGSLGGLTAGVLLHELGHDVHVFERSSSALEGRGAGIVVLPMTERYLIERGRALDAADSPEVALTLKHWTYLNRDGEVIVETESNYRFTAWNTLYRAVLDALPSERYLLGHRGSGVRPAPDGATVAVDFANGHVHECDLLIGADGMGSAIRDHVAPGTATTYAGYVAWRGTFAEGDVSTEAADALEDAILYQVLDHSHFLAYFIPGPDDSIERGRRSINFVWYRNAADAHFDELMTDKNGERRPTTMPPGMLADRFVAELHAEGRRQLAPLLCELVLACPDPFIQAIFDMSADRFVSGRAIILGDAATLVRPHIGAGTAKACADAYALRDHLRDGDDLDTALGAWEVAQLELATTASARARAMGEASQVHSTMIPGDPAWQFGLASAGGS